MGQIHLTIDFPIKGPANAKALTEGLPPLMPDFARTQDELGTVHYSRFMVKGDENLLFLSDLDGEIETHLARIVEHASPVLDAIFTHVEDAPAIPAADDPQTVIKWLKHRVREPLDTYFAYEASVQEIKAAARAAGFTGQTQQSPLLIIMSFKSRLRAFALKLVGEALFHEKGKEALESVGTVHFSDWVPFENNQMGFFTVYDGDFKQYVQDFADKSTVVFDTVFPHVEGAPPTSVAKNAAAFYQWALKENNPPIGFYSAYPGLSVQDVRALLADYREPASTTAG